MTPPADTASMAARMQQLQHCRVQWHHLITKLFEDRIYTVCQHRHPGMGIEVAAVRHIAEIMTRVLFEILEQKPENGRDMVAKMRNVFPTAITNFAFKPNELKGDLKRHYQGTRKTKESKVLAELHRRLHATANEHLGRKLDDDAILIIINALESILDDIVNWGGKYVTKLMEDTSIITLPSLKSSINADGGLADLMEILFNEDEASAGGVLNQVTADQRSSVDEEKKQVTSAPQNAKSVCRNFRDDEMQFVRDLSVIMYVFKHRLEARLGKDPRGKLFLQSIFGNVQEIHELAIRIHRTIEDAIDMSDPPCMGMGLAEFVEGREFDVYIEFMEIFREPLSQKLAQLLKEAEYQQFFDIEDRQCVSTPEGQTFRMAVKYVLPSLLHSVVLHFKTYLKYIEDLMNMSESETDKTDLRNVEFYLKTDVANTIKSLKLPPNPYIEKPAVLRRNKPDHLNIIQRVQRSIDGWVGEEIGYTCNEFIREGNLLKKTTASSIAGTSFGRSATPRHVFLFDHLLVICKEKGGKDKERPYKYKDKMSIRKSDVADLEDTEDMKNAFEVRSTGKEGEQTRITLICASAEEKEDWMTSLVERQTAGVLHRMLDMYQKEEEKRIPLMIPTQSEYRFAEPDTDENIVFEDYTHNSGIPVVKQGTIIKLVERLTYPQYTDNEFVKTFMTTFRSFCKPSELLSLLIERFNVPVPQIFAEQQLAGLPSAPYKSGGPLAGRYDTVQSHGLSHFNQLSQTQLEQAYQRFRKEYQKPIQFKVLRILNHWVSHHFYDFEMDQELLGRLVAFLSGNDKSVVLTTDQKRWCSTILEMIRKKQSANGETSPKAGASERGIDCPRTPNDDGLQPTSSYTPEMPEILWHYAKKGECGTYDLLTLHPLEIGRQITLLESILYRAIKPIELVDGAWMDKKDKYRKSPQLLKYVKHTDNLTYWVTRSLVETESLEERVAMFARVLEIMVVFEELNNFNGVVAFYSALAHSAVFRLKESQKRLDKEKKDWYDRFMNMCTDKRWNSIVQKLHNINPPCLPFAGLYMTQITFFKASKSMVKQEEDVAHEKDHESSLSHKRISFGHCRKIAGIIREIQMYQNQPYALREEPSMRQFFESLNPLQGFKDTDDLETYLYEQSVKIEPKDGVISSVKPKRPPEALKSPGIKASKNAGASTFQRSRSHNVNHHNHHSTTLTKVPRSPPTTSGRHSNVTSPPSSAISRTPNTAKTCVTALSPSPTSDDSHFAIVDINPGHQPRWVSDAGRINQAFTSEYASPAPLSSGPPLSPRSPPAVSQLPQKRKPPAPLSSGETRFAFPPTSSYKPPAPLPPHIAEPPASASAFPLVNPPRRRLADPPPVGGSGSQLSSAPLLGGIATATKPPPLFPKSKRTNATVNGANGEGSISPDAVNEPSTSSSLSREASVGGVQENLRVVRDSPNVPPRIAGMRHLPPPLPADTLNAEVTGHVRSSASLPPRSPTVSLLVPLPSHPASANSAPSTATPSTASPPPLPPRHQRSSLSPELPPEGASLAPPRPPKPGRRSNATPIHLPPEEPSEPAFAPPLPPKPVKKRSPLL